MPPELENFVHTKVTSGLYQSASEVVREALRLLAEQDNIRYKVLNSEIDKGLVNLADGKYLTSEELREYINNRRNNSNKNDI